MYNCFTIISLKTSKKFVKVPKFLKNNVLWLGGLKCFIISITVAPHFWILDSAGWSVNLPLVLVDLSVCPCVSPSITPFWQDCFIVFFTFFCLKLGFNKHKKVMEIFFREKFLFCPEWGKSVIFRPKINFS